ncbi:MAG: hypothetical protein HY912_24830 [Desulfomonile tiedjei]|uniref:Uncharacterized protein n=1 Tax=Desulfomonile tiedjei TaxID=2358 RepID=A0A9D6Z617_9BACT|nr:hypothetical protein [Desulfomonile tiedjei]
MGKLYQQFLGSKPGITVEIVDDSSSPFLVRTGTGFEFFVSTEDFRNYYKDQGSPTPPRWRHLITDAHSGMVDAQKMAQVMEIIHSFEETLQDFDKARSVVRKLIEFIEDNPSAHPDELLLKLEESGWGRDGLAGNDVQQLINVPAQIRQLLQNEECAELQVTELPEAATTLEFSQAEPGTAKKAAAGEKKQLQKTPVKSRVVGMKNVIMAVDGDILQIEIDLSKEFGPSKSGKTTIIASTEGNKSVPGRPEKIGLNVYRQEAKKSAKGRKKSFKNVEMELKDRILSITLDLSKEFGPSKSGKTIIIASSEGNQLVYGSEEKIGLNVYRKIE